MTTHSPMKLIDIDKAVPSFDERHELKEAICDSLINLTHARVSGRGSGGDIVYRLRPSEWFASDFLLPRFNVAGDDESSDIHIAVHGVEFKVRRGPDGNITVRPSFAVYVRVLPTWEELSNPTLALVPKLRLKTRVRQDILARALDRTSHAQSQGDRRPRRALLTLFSREIMAELGIRLEGESNRNVLATAEEQFGGSDGDTAGDGPAPVETPPEGPGGAARVTLVDRLDDGDFAPDSLCVEEDIPLKWRRLPVAAPELTLSLAEDETARRHAIETHNAALRTAIEQAYTSFIVSEEGQAWAWRSGRFGPNVYRAQAKWEHALQTLRSRPPTLSDLYPRQEPRIAVEWTPEPLDSNVTSVRIALEHITAADLGEPGLFQVNLQVELPAVALKPFTLERVKPSYAIADYMHVDAAGVNCGVESHRSAEGASVQLKTTWAPRYYLPRIVPNEIQEFDVTFRGLSDPSRPVALLNTLPAEFDKWIQDVESNTDPERGLDPDDQTSRLRERAHFQKDVEDWRREIASLRAGIALLQESETAFRADPTSRKAFPFRAWILMNRTFLNAARQRGWDENAAGWRLFQIGFVLSGITAVATRMQEFHAHYVPERDERVALLYFATGGGKSEAFFGLMIFTLFLDRLRGKLRGVSALMRYPLRLLTAQQARRLARLLAEAEMLKAQEGIPGAPFEIGFWVGSTSTPNDTLDRNGALIADLKDVPRIGPSPRVDERAALQSNGYRGALKDFNKLHSCPFCSAPTALRLYPREKMRLGIVCLEETCRWNKLWAKGQRSAELRPLPFLLVDRDIYRRAPAILLGTVDKLALLGQHPSTINRLAAIFGLARWVEDATGLLEMPDREKDLQDGPPVGWSTVAPAYVGGQEVFVDPVPSIIVQDEAHLLEESLGTFAGLFETTLYQWFRELRPILGNRMATVPGAPTQVRLPKVIAATATVSDPVKQVEALYQREVERFPQPGPALYRSFYAGPRQFDGAARERAGWATRQKDEEWLAPWARVYVSLLTNGRPHTVTTVTILSAFMAIITRLMRDLCDTDPAARQAAVHALNSNLSISPLQRRHAEAIRLHEAAGRHDVIASVVDLHRVALTYVTNKKGGDQILSAAAGIVDQEHRALGSKYTVEDVQMRLISGGVESGEIDSIVKEAEKAFDPAGEDISETLRMIVATSAISHGVDVERFNSMFFAGMPTDISEYIQASSRVGRTHVGFVMLIPTPQARRDRYIVEVHEVFHRFLERMIAPPAVERWASRAVRRVLPSIIQNWLCGIVSQDEFRKAPPGGKAQVPRYAERREIRHLKQRMRDQTFKRELIDHILAAIGADEPIGGAGVDRTTYESLVATQIEIFVQNLDEPHAAGDMREFWAYYRDQLDEPMTSLRDVDAPGRIVAHAERGNEGARERLRETMRFIRDGKVK